MAVVKVDALNKSACSAWTGERSRGRKGFREAIGRAIGTGPLRMNRSLSGETRKGHSRWNGIATAVETGRGSNVR